MKKYGFVYLWRDRKNKRYYVGSHWGAEDDNYICSSRWMKSCYKKRPADFKRRVIKRIYTGRKDLLDEEQRFLNMIKQTEIISSSNTKLDERELNVRYYNLNLLVNDFWHTYDNEHKKTINEKISDNRKGKYTGYRDPSVGEAISKSKKAAFEHRGGMTEAHKRALSGPRPNAKHTDEWKQENSERMRTIWTERRVSGADKFGPMSEEEKQKRRKVPGKYEYVPSVEHIKKLSDINSSEYNITLLDGSSFIIKNLKEFSKKTGIPYITLSKASRSGSSINKYTIASINKTC